MWRDDPEAAGPELYSRKKSLRVDSKTRRRETAAQLPPQQAGHCIRDQLIAGVPVRPDDVVAAYWPMGDEIDPLPALHHFLNAGHIGGLPVVIGKAQPLEFRRYEEGDPLIAAGFGTSVPNTEAETVLPTLLLVPLLAFDRAGYRLGYGGGFYDRTLAKLRAASERVTAVGVAYSSQEVPDVPRESTDMPLDWIVTETDVIARISR